MSRYLQLNDQPEAAELSSNAGWSQFLDWVSKLDEKEYPDLVKFSNDGTSSDLQKVADQLEAAMDDSSPNKDVNGIIGSLFEYLDGSTGIASVV
jgi:hypothetical protein